MSALQRLPDLHGLSIDFLSDNTDIAKGSTERCGRYLRSAEIMLRVRTPNTSCLGTPRFTSKCCLESTA